MFENFFRPVLGVCLEEPFVEITFCLSVYDDQFLYHLNHTVSLRLNGQTLPTYVFNWYRRCLFQNGQVIIIRVVYKDETEVLTSLKNPSVHGVYRYHVRRIVLFVYIIALYVNSVVSRNHEIANGFFR